MKFATALADFRSGRIDSAALGELARTALQEGEEERAVEIVEAAAQSSNDARLWQWAGLLHRALDQHREALLAFDQAAKAAPDDASIAHGRARVALEAGLDARSLFERALALSGSKDVILGLASARYAAGEGEQALAELAAYMARDPGWAQGHVQWAQLASMTGHVDSASATIAQALALHPDDPALWEAAIEIARAGEHHVQAARLAEAALATAAKPGRFALSYAAALSDAGDRARAGAAFDELGEAADVYHAILLARQFIRTQRWGELLALADRWMTGASAHPFWPYASIAWRMTDDPRWAWLEGDERLISVIDISERLPLDELAELLRGLHRRSGRFLDQSVRGGTQTDGPLLSRINPAIRALREAIVGAVEEYRRALPPLDERHPMHAEVGRRRVRFAGSWSIRLQDQGHHSNHVHPQGAISSALYIALPEEAEDDQGWLVIGEPQAGLCDQLTPFRTIQPKVGQLVLFPSMMWHGTRPFVNGERLTVAFDVARP